MAIEELQELKRLYADMTNADQYGEDGEAKGQMVPRAMMDRFESLIAQLEHQASAQGVTDERAAFEAWATSERYTVRQKDNVYTTNTAKLLWESWQARARLSTQASAKEAPAVVDGKVPALSHELYELYPAMSAQSHEEEVKAYGRQCAALAYRQECARKAGAGQAVVDQPIDRKRVVAELGRVADVYGLDIGDSRQAAVVEEAVWQVWRALQARAVAQAAVAQEPVAVPQDCKLVPVEPTEIMLNAARDWSSKKYGIPVGNDGALGCWNAMLAAVPVPPAAQAGDARDAARYRYLKEHADVVLDKHVWITTDEGQRIHVQAFCRHETDRAIDAAMENKT